MPPEGKWTPHPQPGKRRYYVSVWLTDAEATTIERLSCLTGLTRSQLFREALRRSQPAFQMTWGRLAARGEKDLERWRKKLKRELK